jgi:hypothetical protein
MSNVQCLGATEENTNTNHVDGPRVYVDMIILCFNAAQLVILKYEKGSLNLRLGSMRTALCLRSNKEENYIHEGKIGSNVRLASSRNNVQYVSFVLIFEGLSTISVLK